MSVYTFSNGIKLVSKSDIDVSVKITDKLYALNYTEFLDQGQLYYPTFSKEGEKKDIYFDTIPF